MPKKKPLFTEIMEPSDVMRREGLLYTPKPTRKRRVKLRLKKVGRGFVKAGRVTGRFTRKVGRGGLKTYKVGKAIQKGAKKYKLHKYYKKSKKQDFWDWS